MKLFGSSGIRGVVNKELIQLALEVGLSLGTQYRSTIMGSDTRTSSPALKYALAAGLAASGSTIYDAGTLPTPALAYVARNFEAGVMITASHNPPEYNGIKLWNPDGSAFDSHQRKQIEESVFCHNTILSWEKMGRSETYPGAIEMYLNRLLEEFNKSLSLKVVVDCSCGAASLATPYLLTKLGCQVIALNSHPSGFFPRGIEPTPDNLEILKTAVVAVGANLGIAHDGDGDRMVALDEKGRVVPGDKMLALFARYLKAKKIITTVDASLMLEDLGLEVVRTPVGDAFVSGELRKGGDFGGESSGSWIFPNISYCPDGIYAAAQVAKIVSQNKLSQLVEDLPSYPLLRGSIAGDRKVMDKLERKLLKKSPLSTSTIDGLRLSFEEGWLLIRPSGTEPKIRITAEAKSQKKVEELYNWGLCAIKECMKEGI